MNTRLQTHAERDRSELSDIKRRAAAYWDEVKSYFRDYKKKVNRDALEKKREESGKSAEKFGEAIEGLSKFLQEQIKIAIEDFAYSLHVAERNIGAPVSLSHEFVSATTLERIQQEVALEIAQVKNFADKIEKEEFIGPLRPEMKSLVEEFRAQRIGRDQFIEEALSLRGIIFSDSGAHVAISARRMDNLRSEFNLGGYGRDYGAQDKVVLVFRQATMHVHFSPDREYSPPNGEPILEKVPAPTLR